MITFSDSAVDAALQKAPPEVQEVVLEGRIFVAAVTIGEGSGLHVDQVGKVSSLGMYMLLGLLSPTQFVSELKGVGVSEDTANKVVQELNSRVFAPLLETIKARETKIPALETVKEPVSTPKQVPPPTTKTPPLPPPQKPEIPLPPPLPAVRTMATDVVATTKPSEAKTATPLGILRPLSSGANVIPPLPATTPMTSPPHTQSPTPKVIPLPKKEPLSAPSEKEVIETLKTYGVDPYREPLE